MEAYQELEKTQDNIYLSWYAKISKMDLYVNKKQGMERTGKHKHWLVGAGDYDMTAKRQYQYFMITWNKCGSPSINTSIYWYSVLMK